MSDIFSRDSEPKTVYSMFRRKIIIYAYVRFNTFEVKNKILLFIRVDNILSSLIKLTIKKRYESCSQSHGQ